MTKPRLEKVEALFYVLQQVIKRGRAMNFDTPSAIAILDKGRDAAMNNPHVLFTIQQTKLYSLQFAALLAIVVISVFKPWKKKHSGQLSVNVVK